MCACVEAHYSESDEEEDKTVHNHSVNGKNVLLLQVNYTR
jgi:hypothetical protein